MDVGTTDLFGGSFASPDSGVVVLGVGDSFHAIIGGPRDVVKLLVRGRNGLGIVRRGDGGEVVEGRTIRRGS